MCLIPLFSFPHSKRVQTAKLAATCQCQPRHQNEAACQLHWYERGERIPFGRTYSALVSLSLSLSDSLSLTHNTSNRTGDGIEHEQASIVSCTRSPIARTIIFFCSTRICIAHKQLTQPAGPCQSSRSALAPGACSAVLIATRARTFVLPVHVYVHTSTV